MSFVTTSNSKLDIEKMKSKSDVCAFVLSIELIVNKWKSLNYLKATIYNHLKQIINHYYKRKLDKNMLQLPDVKAMPKFEAFCICDNGAVIAVSSIARKILEIVTTFDNSSFLTNSYFGVVAVVGFKL